MANSTRPYSPFMRRNVDRGPPVTETPFGVTNSIYPGVETPRFSFGSSGRFQPSTITEPRTPGFGIPNQATGFQRGPPSTITASSNFGFGNYAPLSQPSTFRNPNAPPTSTTAVPTIGSKNLAPISTGSQSFLLKDHGDGPTSKTNIPPIRSASTNSVPPATGYSHYTYRNPGQGSTFTNTAKSPSMGYGDSNSPTTTGAEFSHSTFRNPNAPAPAQSSIMENNLKNFPTYSSPPKIESQLNAFSFDNPAQRSAFGSQTQNSMSFDSSRAFNPSNLTQSPNASSPGLTMPAISGRPEQNTFTFDGSSQRSAFGGQTQNSMSFGSSRSLNLSNSTPSPNASSPVSTLPVTSGRPQQNTFSFDDSSHPTAFGRQTQNSNIRNQPPQPNLSGSGTTMPGISGRSHERTFSFDDSTRRLEFSGQRQDQNSNSMSLNSFGTSNTGNSPLSPNAWSSGATMTMSSSSERLQQNTFSSDGSAKRSAYGRPMPTQNSRRSDSPGTLNTGNPNQPPYGLSSGTTMSAISGKPQQNALRYEGSPQSLGFGGQSQAQTSMSFSSPGTSNIGNPSSLLNTSSSRTEISGRPQQNLSAFGSKSSETNRPLLPGSPERNVSRFGTEEDSSNFSLRPSYVPDHRTSEFGQNSSRPSDELPKGFVFGNSTISAFKSPITEENEKKLFEIPPKGTSYSNFIGFVGQQNLPKGSNLNTTTTTATQQPPPGARTSFTMNTSSTPGFSIGQPAASARPNLQNPSPNKEFRFPTLTQQNDFNRQNQQQQSGFQNNQSARIMSSATPGRTSSDFGQRQLNQQPPPPPQPLSSLCAGCDGPPSRNLNPTNPYNSNALGLHQFGQTIQPGQGGYFNFDTAEKTNNASRLGTNAMFRGAGESQTTR